ncbi:MAG: hypothetical protein JOZ41_08370 [Chloroflexi bacterium]|nr:hypothetical protein [Chloroflexota bacterium]
MPKRPKMWVYSPPKPPKPAVPEALKREVDAKASELVASSLKPKYIKPPPEDQRFNYVVDIFTKWYRSYFYFCATYRSPGPTAISPFFEARFARLEYIGADRFALAYMRHTGQWAEIYPDLSLDECLAAVRDDPFFTL